MLSEQNSESFLYKQNGHSMDSGERNSETDVNSKKQRCSVTDKGNIVSKRLCSEFPSDLQNKSRQDLLDELHNAYQTSQYKNYSPHQLIELMYRLNLSVPCSLKKLMHKVKYP